MNHASAINRQELRLRVVSAGDKDVFRSPVMGPILWILDRMCLPEGRKLWVDDEIVLAIGSECFASPLIEMAIK